MEFPELQSCHVTNANYKLASEFNQGEKSVSVMGINWGEAGPYSHGSSPLEFSKGQPHLISNAEVPKATPDSQGLLISRRRPIAELACQYPSSPEPSSEEISKGW